MKKKNKQKQELKQINKEKLEKSKEKILKLKENVKENFIEIGKELFKIKNEIPYGEWENWVEKELSFGIATAQRFIKVYKNPELLNNIWGNKPIVNDVSEPIPPPKGKYNIIYADPPWKYADRLNLQGEGAELHYKTMSLDELKNLKEMIDKIGDKDCILFLWVTRPMIPIACELVEYWGFTYKTVAFTWAKTNPKARTFFKGIGRWVMGCTEYVFLATKGNPKRINKNIHELVVAPRSKHSEKPNEVRERIVKLMGDIPRIELFARDRFEGWDVWGDEIPKEIQKKIK